MIVLIHHDDSEADVRAQSAYHPPDLEMAPWTRIWPTALGAIARLVCRLQLAPEFERQHMRMARMEAQPTSEVILAWS